MRQKTFRLFSRAALVLLMMMLTATSAWADGTATLATDSEIAVGTAGHYYVNMPATGTNTLTITAQDITDGKGTFKVYDDGGKSGMYSLNCDGYLTLVAPTNCTLQLTGTVNFRKSNNLTENSANPRFWIYDGNASANTLIKVWSTSNIVNENIGTINSTGNTVTLYLYNSMSNTISLRDGVDITVTVISPDTEYAVSIADGIAHGSITTDKATAKADETITLTATPASGYLLNGISVTDKIGSTVPVSFTPWYKGEMGATSATFIMPKSNANVTATFTKIDNTSNEFSINLPKTGTETGSIPSDMVSFKVYDDGGASGNYGPNSNAKLTLTAPSGYSFQISGNVDVFFNEETSWVLKISDGTSTLGSWQNVNTAINPFICNGNTLVIEFISDSRDFHYGHSGFDFIVSLINPSLAHSVTISSVEHGTMTADVTSATAGTNVTLTASPATEGSTHYILSGVTATYTENGTQKTLDVNGGWWTNNVLTFTMPYSDVTITPTFVEGNADGGPNISGLTYVAKCGDAPGYYKIDSPTALNALATYVNGGGRNEGMLFKQTTDINMNGQGYTPIGNTGGHPFKGTYDGDGYVISNISHSASSSVGSSGMFGVLEGTAKNANLKDCSFYGDYAGGIAGYMRSGTIDNCTVIGGTVSCPALGFSGGIVGSFDNGTVMNCFATNTVSATSVYEDYNGPIVGKVGGYTNNNYYTFAVLGGGSDGGTMVTVYTITLGDGVTMSGNFRTVGRTAANTYHFGMQNDVVTLGAAPAGYLYTYTVSKTAGGTDITASALSGNTLTMPECDVTVALSKSINHADFSVNDAGTEYTIHTVAGWGVFCDLLAADGGKERFSGKTVRLADDITVSRMAGSSYHDFTGTFDGDGKTLTFSATAAENYCAPFRYVEGTSESHAVIRNLNVETTINATGYRHAAGLIALQGGYVDVTNCNATVNITSTIGANNDTELYPAALVSQVSSGSQLNVSGCTTSGTISTDGKYAGGMISIVQGSASVTDCRSSVTINSSTSGDGTHGGLVASQSSKTTINITGCVFDGRLLGASTNKCGGFIGWRGGAAAVTNSLFAPAEVSVLNTESATFARNKVDTYNCYYTNYLCDDTNYKPYLYNGNVSPALWNNGIEAYVYTPATESFVPANVGAAGTTYSVSGITAYASGLKYNGKFYMVKANVSLANNADNSAAIVNKQVANVTLSGRTLYKDGYWNTLVLPFDVTIASSPLAGDNVVAKVLNDESSKLVNGTLTLNFDNAPATIPAGTPFIIKWDKSDDLVNPVFTGVTIDNTNRDVNFKDGSGSFMGTYAPLEITEANRSKVLLLSGGNKLGYAKTDRTIANKKALGTCRAYFYFPGSQTARSFVMNFGEDDTQTTGIVHTEITESTEMAGAIYDLQGRRIEKPKKGLYIVNGKKVLVH